MRKSLPVIQDASGPALPAPAPATRRPEGARRAPAATRKPEWLKIRPPGGELYTAMKHRARRLKLATVCEEAQCPNLSECWAGGTATFMLMGEVCTRGCRFCAVDTKKLPPPLDPDEPRAIAEAVQEMGLTYVVLTSVNRDELADGGAGHLADCLSAIHARCPTVLLEMLSPDFEGNMRSVELVASTPLAVFAHNVETVERLTPSVRDPRASYAQSLEVLEHAKRFAPHLLTKTSLMLGLGETAAEIEATLADLREVDCDIVTFGQYLQPSHKHLPVVEFIHPDTFERYAALAKELGFGYVASGPLVRSSYRAGELFVERHLAARPALAPTA